MISRITTVFTATLIGIGAGGPSLAQDAGHDIFMQYCSTCHGTDAKGAGPLTELMTAKPADLTQLAANNDGKFPMLDVIHVIDGRTGVRAHGGPMPTYGAVFKAEYGTGDYGAEIAARGRILSVAYYLESIQE
ncbi:c-type cytochrome [Oceanibium sediminis]|uniref:c-type cytochrome n=1 Tax=Oceanibium sediminis TaxID=2026339 RepID=UPI001E2EDD77|nr:cytochrome c [Oceanibium sediminis]